MSKEKISLGVSAVDSNRQTIFVADAHRGDGNSFVVRADEKLTAFRELEAAIRAGGAIVLDERTAVFQAERRDTARLVEK